MNNSDTSPLDLLLVDDHAIVREGVKFILESPGGDRQWSVKVASSGFEALDCLRAAPFNVAIVDLSMPSMNGLDLIRRIKNEFPRVMVLVLSMHAEDQYAVRAFRNGANGYLTKDGAGAELVAAVRKVAQGGTYVTVSTHESRIQDKLQLPSLAALIRYGIEHQLDKVN